jgi:hypothetical protein
MISNAWGWDFMVLFGPWSWDLGGRLQSLSFLTGVLGV